MRKYILVLAALLVLPWLAACAAQPAVNEVGLDESFTLSPGESASVRGEDLTVRFVGVINDSRCPEGAVCIWAGEVSCTLEITYGGKVNTKVLVQPGQTEPPVTGFGDYRITYDVRPYPRVGETIEKADYRLSLTIGKQQSTSVGLDERFVLNPGQGASITGEDLALRFVEVIGDSRCPTGVTCIWAGEVSCLLEITRSGKTSEKVLTQPGQTEPPTTDFDDYRITFDVQPYPRAGEQIKPEDYRLTLAVGKKPVLSGGILATFDVFGEKYSIFITNPKTIDMVLALQRGQSMATIPSGRILRGAVDYNRPWSWHIDSEDIEMAEVTMELCDGTPSQVEANLDYWVETVQRFCPWGADLSSVEDFR
jgi:hypothetical protein